MKYGELIDDMKKVDDNDRLRVNSI